ncbi:MAG: DMT family transporter [Tuberibacillus sp.]
MRKRKMLKKLSGILAVLCGASLYGCLNSVVKLAYKEGFSFSQITFSQYIYGFIGLLILTLMTKGFRKMPLKAFVHLSLLGLFGLGGTSLFLYACLSVEPTSTALVLLFQFTWIGILIERFVFKKRIHKGQVLAVLFVIAGTFCVLQIGSITFEDLSWFGIATGLLAACCYSIFLIGVSVFPPIIPEFYKSMIMVMVNVVVFFIIFSAVEPIREINPFGTIWIWGLILGVMGQLLPPLLLSYGAPIIGGTTTSILSSVELPVGIIVSGIMIKDTIDVVQWIGVVLILAGIYFAILRPKSERLKSAKD